MEFSEIMKSVSPSADTKLMLVLFVINIYFLTQNKSRTNSYTMVFFSLKAIVVFTPQAEDVSWDVRRKILHIMLLDLLCLYAERHQEKIIEILF